MPVCLWATNDSWELEAFSRATEHPRGGDLATVRPLTSHQAVTSTNITHRSDTEPWCINTSIPTYTHTNTRVDFLWVPWGESTNYCAGRNTQSITKTQKDFCERDKGLFTPSQNFRHDFFGLTRLLLMNPIPHCKLRAKSFLQRFLKGCNFQTLGKENHLWYAVLVVCIGLGRNGQSTLKLIIPATQLKKLQHFTGLKNDLLHNRFIV